MKNILYIMIALMLGACGSSAKKQQTEEKKSVIFYFSHSESKNTQTIAQFIAEATGAELVELTPAEAYPTEMDKCLARAENERKNKIFPAAQPVNIDLSQYDKVYVGFPNWFGGCPMMVAGFLKDHDWSGKTIIPFITHGTGGRQDCFTDVQTYTPGAENLYGFNCKGEEAKQAKEAVLKWLTEIGIIK